LMGVTINPESRVKVAMGPAAPELLENGWRQFLVKVQNDAGVTAELKANSAQAGDVYSRNAPGTITKDMIPDRWLEMQMFNARPVNKNLSGLELEYRIIQLYSRDSGKRQATVSFNVGQGTQDVGFRSEVSILFKCVPSTPVTFNILDEDGKSSTAALTIRDKLGRVYPSQAKRLAPDFFFHPQVYRHDGEKVTLPAGDFTMEISRGPEYVISSRKITVGMEPQTVKINLQRWVDPAKAGWWSGDHHIHAAGCAHYTNPTEGVHAIDMIRQILGEDLKVGSNLTWGPCFDYQKQFFTGKDDKVSQYPYILRYDVEVSGFGSHQSGHLVLLRLKEEIYPGGDSWKHWPTLGLNTLKWAKKQGAVCGPAHSGSGLDVRTNELPNYIIPPYNGIGANEFVVDITHMVPGPDGTPVPAIDFTSTVDTNYYSELNMWYHSLNAGFRVRASGETDFPCITGERVGLGRSYVKLDTLDYNQWCEGIRQGKCYVSDGRSHLMDFKVNQTNVGENGSEIKLTSPSKISATAKVAALLPEKPTPNTPDRRGFGSWNLAKARIGDTRNVKVEFIVNGKPVASQELTADGNARDITFDNIQIDRSSWVAMRILPSSHTNPVFVVVADKPIRASKKSAQWCLDGVEQCWKSKERFYKQDEKADAKAAYDHAREVYRKIVEESDVD
ncbi:MAG TPA: CehA/McbA family metallohydrolase, partial [Tepidisphaeraceae bacterium]|nr:CehA/McbA family metallohydrolase [Tepidisphaeraceae bacterium]